MIRCLIAFMLFGLSHHACGADLISLDELIAEVRRQEARFANVEIELGVDYECFAKGSSTGLRRFHEDLQVIAQDGMYFCSEKRRGKIDGGGDHSFDQTSGSDGACTWVNQPSELSVLPDGTRLSRESPHTMLLLPRINPSLEGRTLSEFLESGTANEAMTCVVEGTDRINGLECIRVLRTSWFPMQIKESRLLWLARDRGYQPIRTIAWWDDRPVLVEESQVKSWVDVDQGLWCPHRLEVIKNSRPVAGQRPQPICRFVTETTKVELTPAHDPMKFQAPPKRAP